MAKFCAECGAELTATGKFCGSCGAAVPIEIKHCPTCGQKWDGKKLEPKANKPARADVASQIQEPEPEPEPEVLVTTTPSARRIVHNTTAAVQPIYGPLYVEGKDCPNCGTANMANKTCKTCESEN